MPASPETTESANAFSATQKEYLTGFLAGIAQRRLSAYVGATPQGKFTDNPGDGGQNLAAPNEVTIFGTPLSEVTKQERWKHEEHPLDGWDRILAHAEAEKFPNEEDTYRFRNFGMFFVGP